MCTVPSAEVAELWLEALEESAKRLSGRYAATAAAVTNVAEAAVRGRGFADRGGECQESAITRLPQVFLWT